MTEQPNPHVEDQIQAYLTDGLTPEERRAFDVHVSNCQPCGTALAAAREDDETMTALFAHARPNQDFEDRLIQNLRAARPPRGPLLHPMVRRAAVGIAATIVMGGVGVVVTNALADRGFPTATGTTLLAVRASNRNVSQTDLYAFGSRGFANLPATQPGLTMADANGVLDQKEVLAKRLSTGRELQRGRGESEEVLRQQLSDNRGVNEWRFRFEPTRDLPKLGVQDGEAKQPLELKYGDMLVQKKEAETMGRKQLGTVMEAESDLFQNANRSKDAAAAKPPSGAAAGGTVTLHTGVRDLLDNVPDFTDAPTFALETGQPATAPAANSRKIIRNGTMQFEVDRFDDALLRITKLVVEQGGFIATTDSDKLPNGKMKGTVTLRVPPEHLDSLVLTLRGIGDLKSQKIGAEDVSKHYTDLESELRAARAMQDRLMEIIKSGKGQIKDLLEAEKQLGVWREKIEKIEGEKRYLDNLISLSTLTVELAERDIRTPATASETEQVSMSLETEKVDDAYEKARAAIESAKGRIIQSEMKQFEAGQFGATVQAAVPPDAAEQVIARLRQLDGRIAHFAREAKRTTQNGNAPMTGVTTVRREDVVIAMQIYNLANVAPRRTTSVVLATANVDATYQSLLEQIRNAGGRVVTSSLARPDSKQQSADVDFQVPADKAQSLEDALRALGDVMRHDATENPDTANVTEAKRGFHLRIVSVATVPPRESQDVSLAAADVPAAFNDLLTAVNAAQGRIIQSDLKEQDPHDKTAALAFEIPRTALAGVNAAMSKSGQVLTRTVNRSADVENTLDSKVRLSLSLGSAEKLPPRQTVTVREEVTDVERAADDLVNAAVSAGGRRIGAGDVTQDRAGHVTAQVIVEVPGDKAATILDQLERAGRRRGKQVAFDTSVPEGPLARVRIDATFSNSAASLGGEESTWDALRRGLETSALGLRWSLQMLVIGLCFVAPWILVLWAVWRLARRRPRIRPTAPTTA